MLTFDARLYAADGLLLFSTNQTDEAQLRANAAEFGPSFRVPGTFNPSRVRLAEESANGTSSLDHRFTKALARLEHGQSDFILDAVQYPDYEQAVVVNRLRGPFPLSYEIPEQEMTRTWSGPKAVGSDGLLGDTIPARLEGVVINERNETTFSVQVRHRPQTTVSLAGLGLNATVVQHSPTTFQLRLDAEIGHTFGIGAPCAVGEYAFAPGSYRLAATDEWSLHFEWSPETYPQLVGQSVRLVGSVLENTHNDGEDL